MTGGRKKQEPRLVLDMDFGEALERFARTKPSEVAESIARPKRKKPPGDARPPGGLEKPMVKPSNDRKRKPSGGA